MRPLANQFIKILESPDPSSIYCYTPGIVVLPNGKLFATAEYGGPGMKEYFKRMDPITEQPLEHLGMGFLSDDKGVHWRKTVEFPMTHARPFLSGDSLYILGHLGDLRIMRSDDCGQQWSDVHALTYGETWHQSACNVLHAKGNVYLVMEKQKYHDVKGWDVNALAPVLMRAKQGDDLLKTESWTFADELAYSDVVNDTQLDFFGVPFYDIPEKEYIDLAPGRGCACMGWLETNVAQIVDSNHYWYDPSGNTIHLIARAHTGGTGYAALAKAAENEDGTISTLLEQVPSGKKQLFLPLPGGQMRFHIEYDEISKLYWLLSTQATDSMTRVELLPDTRYNLPNNERNRMQLHFSKNLVDWCFAGIVAIGSCDKASRHYACFAFDGDDIVLVSRSGDEKAYSAHNGNFISFHRIQNFRELIY